MLGLSLLLAISSIFFIYQMILIGFQIWGNTGEGDENNKRKAIKNFVWSGIAFILITSASTIAGVFAAIFINQSWFKFT